MWPVGLSVAAADDVIKVDATVAVGTAALGI